MARRRHTDGRGYPESQPVRRPPAPNPSLDEERVPASHDLGPVFDDTSQFGGLMVVIDTATGKQVWQHDWGPPRHAVRLLLCR